MQKKLKRWAFKRSLWVFHVNTGGCNGCDIEIVDALTPKYDIERFGIKLVPSPRHADVLLVTGPITKKQADLLKRIYEQTPDPKFVVAIGTCATSGATFEGAYNVIGGVDKVIPVDAYVVGCPARPEAIIDAIATLIDKIDKGEVEKVEKA
ncbi:MAG: NADH-quinone oxidoreductase subunit B family protein [Crenarchaeota archaeon]|nr:NADH-quinone oxidoreductase subunit B family protein [Thermoproteota archaeon]MCR8453588.1 NADH-quinone oxidoreductase subunit B family protein [Thermoproteota archaeon]MCR8456004.1 NADH-quinone oxidoreductase subunit B family protein [Thermoproteota archaeon]MCR8471191.1 NADH-quinone oxidoreductase subunit B family protein [Thermoproteota archaeon]MCR8472345.1 NADH-quinone oxidoreductase subunit B family protein [Thermoproteota archaeon]